MHSAIVTVVQGARGVPTKPLSRAVELVAREIVGNLFAAGY